MKAAVSWMVWRSFVFTDGNGDAPRREEKKHMTEVNPNKWRTHREERVITILGRSVLFAIFAATNPTSMCIASPKTPDQQTFQKGHANACPLLRPFTRPTHTDRGCRPPAAVHCRAGVDQQLRHAVLATPGCFVQRGLTSAPRGFPQTAAATG